MSQEFMPIRKGILDIPSSEIRHIASIGMQMDDVMPFWFGEPHISTPSFVLQAAVKALRDHKIQYTLNRGLLSLRQALSMYMGNLYSLNIDTERVTVTASAMNAISLIMQCIVEPGENVVMLGPLWPNISASVHIMGGEVKEVPLKFENKTWSLDLDSLIDAIDDRTKAMVLNSPNNPTGWVMSRDEQRSVLEYCRERAIWVISDEVYDRITYNNSHAPSFLEISEPDDLVLCVNSFSKTWCMTGWRLGWITSPSNFGPILGKIIEFNISSAPTISQYAGITAVLEGDAFISKMKEEYSAARHLTYQRLSLMSRVNFSIPDGAFYAFFEIDGVRDGLAYAEEVLVKTRVGLAPGGAFGRQYRGHMRLCFANSMEILSEAFDRLEPLMS